MLSDISNRTSIAHRSPQTDIACRIDSLYKARSIGTMSNVVRRTTLSDATAAPTQAAEACADPPYLGEITQCYARAEVWRSRVVAVSYQQRA